MRVLCDCVRLKEAENGFVAENLGDALANRLVTLCWNLQDKGSNVN